MFYEVCFLILFLGIDCSGLSICNFIFRSYQVQFYPLIWVFFFSNMSLIDIFVFKKYYFFSKLLKCIIFEK